MARWVATVKWTGMVVQAKLRFPFRIGLQLYRRLGGSGCLKWWATLSQINKDDAPDSPGRFSLIDL